ncbi:hypothetical protein FM107_20155 [Sphingobacterium sp. JB170]|nr:hypothetical protein FM107_20155 [Sphingobacterium sp. JB170]
MKNFVSIKQLVDYFLSKIQKIDFICGRKKKTGKHFQHLLATTQTRHAEKRPFTCKKQRRYTTKTPRTFQSVSR